MPCGSRGTHLENATLVYDQCVDTCEENHRDSTVLVGEQESFVYIVPYATLHSNNSDE